MAPVTLYFNLAHTSFQKLTANSNPCYGARMTLNFHLLPLMMMMMTDHDVDSDVYITIYLITNALSLDKA